jgi:hypothetical protein
MWIVVLKVSYFCLAIRFISMGMVNRCVWIIERLARLLVNMAAIQAQPFSLGHRVFPLSWLTGFIHPPRRE